MPVKPQILTLLLLLTTPITPAQVPPTPAAPKTPTARAQAAAAALLTPYNPQTGLFNTTGWWNSANALTALTDTARLNPAPNQPPNPAIPRSLATTFTQAPTRFPGFLNDYYDDEGWWALAWIDAFDLTHHQPYLRTAQAIFANMTTGWSPDCGGGIWWSKKRTYKNAIANELFLSVAAHLALHTHGRQRSIYLAWANRDWTWFAQSGMINPDHLINDGLTIDPVTGACTNNGKTTWTYNQGVLLGGLTALSQATHNPQLLTPAHQIAAAAITHLTDPAGILHDPCEPNCGEDGVQFKGIFARNLADLNRVSPNPAYAHFLTTNADTLWRDARTPDDRFSTVWSGPANPPGNAGAQASALDLLNAAALRSSAEQREPHSETRTPVTK